MVWLYLSQGVELQTTMAVEVFKDFKCVLNVFFQSCFDIDTKVFKCVLQSIKLQQSFKRFCFASKQTSYYHMCHTFFHMFQNFGYIIQIYIIHFSLEISLLFYLFIQIFFKKKQIQISQLKKKLFNRCEKIDDTNECCSID